MQTGTPCMGHHNQVAGIVYTNICIDRGSEVPQSERKTPPKVGENGQAKILWDFQIQADKLVMADKPDIALIDNQQRRAVVIDIMILSNSNVRKKENRKLEKYQGVKHDQEKM